MKLRFCFVAFCFTAVAILAIHLRNIHNRVFYELYSNSAEQSRLKQQLWQKQLQLENLTNPAAVSQRLGD
jgi:hypothetical protein